MLVIAYKQRLKLMKWANKDCKYFLQKDTIEKSDFSPIKLATLASMKIDNELIKLVLG